MSSTPESIALAPAFRSARQGPHPLPFTGPWLLAPMEGVTEPCFRDVVLERHAPHELGASFTEFVRVVDGPVSKRSLRRHLGPRRFAIPVGLQLMGSKVDAVAESARRAAEVGAPLIDLNFGCPAKGALRGCAGSALLDDPQALERLVANVVGAVPHLPVTAKIRAGGEDDSRLEEIARAAENGGASLLTVHCRTRREAYADCADWERLRRAVAAVSIPVCGNGGVSVHADLQRLVDETGCSYAMVGRAALGNPWIFSGRRATRAEGGTFLVEYAKALGAAGGGAAGQVARIKQLLRHWTVDGFGKEERLTWLRETDVGRFHERLAQLASEPA